MKAIQIISQDVFDKVRSRFQNLEMGDETGAVTLDPAQARFFDFDFIYEGIDLGRISISLADLGSLKIYYSQGITEDQDDASKQIWYSFLKEMRMFAMRRLLRFDTRDIAKTNLDKNDFQHLAAAQAPKEEDYMKNTMNESRWTGRNTKKTSRAVKGKTEIIVRHTESMEGVHPSLRSHKKKIKGIYIQNHLGERFKYPFEHLDGALAMGMHVEHGGVPYDAAGKTIIGMSEELAKLQEFQKLIHSSTLHDDANQIKERAIGRLHELKAQIKALGKRHHYESWMAEFNEQEHMDDGLTMDDVAMEEYKQKFTQTNFQEELAGYFPLLHRIMSETNTVDLEEYVSEKDVEEGLLKGASIQRGNPRFAQNFPANDKEDNEDPPFEPDEKSNFSKPNNPNRTPTDTAKALAQKGLEKAKSPAESIETFEEWADSMVEGELAPDQMSALKDELSKRQQSGEKLDFDTAYDFFSEFGLSDDQLQKDLESQKSLNSEVDPLVTLRDWAKDAYPDLITQLGNLLPAEQEAEPAPQPEQPAPVGQPQPQQPAAENDNQYMGPGMMEDDKSEKPEPEGDMVETIARLVKSRYNRDNPTVGPFNGKEGIVLDVKKAVSEKFGEKAAMKAEMMAEKFIEKLSNDWHQRHGHGEEQAEEGFGTKLLGGAALIASLWGINSHMAKDVYDNDPQLQKLTQFYQQAEQQNDTFKMKELERRIQMQKDRLDLGHGAVMDKSGKPKEVVPEMASILKLAGLRT
jgi:hypothetical protein